MLYLNDDNEVLKLTFTPELKSVKTHKVPDWFHDAKLGIFIHLGLFSVPAFAITGTDLVNSMKTGPEEHFKNNPYAEWYLNSLRIKGSPTYQYHNEVYGADFKYDDFVPIFNKEIEKWDPEKWADLFKKIGAKYVVFTTKHGDGFLLWHSKYPHPKKTNYTAKRNVVGELTRAIKSRNLKMGFYYSSCWDWSFNETPVTNIKTFLTNGPIDPEYKKYVNNHWRELIDDYGPSILWSDMGYPPNTNLNELFSYFYNKISDGVVNDRWIQTSPFFRKLIEFRPTGSLISWFGKRMLKKGKNIAFKPPHYDFLTPEYTQSKEISEEKWETCRGIGNSFGYNKFETENDYLSVDELIYMFVDIVSKNGNLLLNVGPMVDGTIPSLQLERLIGLGKWLEVNGEAIFETRPWFIAEGKTMSDLDLRYTQKEDTLYAILLNKPNTSITINSILVSENTTIHLLGYNDELKWYQEGVNLKIMLPEKIEDFPAYSFKISPQPKKAS